MFNIQVAFLVVGDPFGATTHSDLVLRAKELGIPHQVCRIEDWFEFVF